MTEASIIAFALLLTACTEGAQQPTPAEWSLLPCDIVEEVTYEVTEVYGAGIRTTITTRSTVLSLIDADPVNVVVRVLRPDEDPCASLEACEVTEDGTLSPDGLHRYHAAGSRLLTGMDGGTTARVVCSETYTGHAVLQLPGQPAEAYDTPTTTQNHAEGGEYAVRGAM